MIRCLRCGCFLTRQEEEDIDTDVLCQNCKEEQNGWKHSNKYR